MIEDAPVFSHTVFPHEVFLVGNEHSVNVEEQESIGMWRGLPFGRVIPYIHTAGAGRPCSAGSGSVPWGEKQESYATYAEQALQVMMRVKVWGWMACWLVGAAVVEGAPWSLDYVAGEDRPYV